MDDNYVGWGIIGYDSIYVFKMNPLGDILWDKLIPNDAYLVQYRPVASLNEDSEGNLLLMTKTTVLKLNDAGELIWEKNFFVEENLFCSDLQLDATDHLILLGRAYPSGIYELVKCDTEGTILFAKETDFQSNSLLVTEDEIILGGERERTRILYFYNFDGDTTETQELPLFLGDPWLVEYEADLTATIAKIALLDNGNLVLRTNETSIYYPWSALALFGSVAEYNTSTLEIISEVLLEDDALTPLGWDYAGPIISTFDGGFAVIGAKRMDVLEYQLAIWKFKNQCDLSLEDEKFNSLISLYPNPASDFIQIESETKITNIFVYDMRGDVLFAGLPLDNRISIQDLKSGVYIIHIQTIDQGFIYKRFTKI